MFEGFKGVLWKKERSLLNKSTLRGVIGEEAAVSEEMSAAQRLWGDMYAAQGGLRIAAALSFEMARLITLEMRSNITGSRRAEFLNKYYAEVTDNIRIPLEYGCAKGGLVMKPYIKDRGIKVDFIQADDFFPLAFDESGRITGAVFVQTMAKDGAYYTRLETHRLEGDAYEISNRAFKSVSSGALGREISLSSVSDWAELSEKTTLKHIKKPLFGYFKPAVANTVDPSSPLGVSVFANAVNLIADADKHYERFLWEFESGERALIANTMAFKRDRDGRLRLPDKRLYKTLDVEDMDFFREWSPEIRQKEFTEGFDMILRQIEFNCGFAYGTLSNLSDSDKTAEEIRTSKQRSYSTVSDNQKALKCALDDLVYAMDVWCTLYNLAPMGEYRTDYEFDDSIAADRKTEFEEKRTLVEAGIMRPWEFRMWYFGEPEENARAAVGEGEQIGAKR